MNMTRLEQFHQRKRDDETDSGPFKASQSGVKHPGPDCSAGQSGAQLAKAVAIKRILFDVQLRQQTRLPSLPDAA
jgi:hypothetical protein